jgi:3-oxoacyl-[acyl-carrier protein] reductase
LSRQRPLALVTGASRGIGRAVAVELARLGFDVAGNSRTFDPADKSAALFETQALVEAAGASFLPVAGDVGSVEDHARMVQIVLDRFGGIDLLVNNAGVAPENRLDLLETTEASFDRVMSINLRGPFFLTQRVARHMIGRRRQGTENRFGIIFITSVSAYVSSPSRAEYCVSKSGLSMAAATFADRLCEHHINVYEVRPGVIDTDMTAGVREKYDKMIADGLIPQSRWGQPADVARAVGALASGDFDYSTGAVIEVSGGMNLRRL